MNGRYRRGTSASNSNSRESRDRRSTIISAASLFHQGAHGGELEVLSGRREVPVVVSILELEQVRVVEGARVEP